MSRVLLAAAVALALAGPAIAGDRVHLTGGSVVEGTIESDAVDEIVLRTGDETRRIPRRLVERVERAGVKGDAKAPVRTRQGRDGPAAAATTGAETPATSAADPALLARLASSEIAERTAALEALVTGWPGTGATLDSALRHADASVRRDAVCLLGRRELGDVSARVRASLADGDANVRTLAIRQVRVRQVTEVEPTLTRMLAADASVMVRLETVRTLEEVGTVACLPAILDAWIAEPEETEPSRRRRFLRVLRKLTAEDAGEDRVANEAAWRAAIARATTRSKEEALRAASGRTSGAKGSAPSDGAAGVPGK